MSFNETRNGADDTIWSPEDLLDPHGRADKAEKVRRMFDAIARRYDRANTVISFGQAGRWRKTLVRMVREQGAEPGRILDLCCGTGAMTRLMGEAFPQARLTGADFSLNMLIHARRQGAKWRDRYVCGDGMTLPFGDESFDLVTCVFGLRNYQSLERGVEEIRRVLRKGGLMAALEFQSPNSRLFRPLVHFYMNRVLPILGAAVTGSRKNGAYDYLPQSVGRWYDIEDVLAVMRQCDLKGLQVRPMCFGSVWAIVAEK